MIVPAHEFELGHSPSGVEDFEAIRRHFISWVVEGEVDVLREQRDRLQSSEELSRCVILDDFLPDLGLLAVSALLEVLWRVKVHVQWPDAAVGIWLSAFLCVVFLRKRRRLVFSHKIIIESL